MAIKTELLSASRDFTKREILKLADFTNATKIDELLAGGDFTLNIDYWAVLHVENENSDSKEYNKCVIVNKEGEKFTTGSATFISTLQDIWEACKDDGEDVVIDVYRAESRNYSGKYFITCSLV